MAKRILALVFIPGVWLAAHGETKDEQASIEVDYLETVSAEAKKILCENQQFLDFTGLNATECVLEINSARQECDQGIGNLIPSIPGGEDQIVRQKKLAALRTLGVLYGECLQNIIYEKGYCGCGERPWERGKEE